VIRAEPLTAAAFAGLGRVVERPALPPDASGHGFAWWAETALLHGADPYALGFLDLAPEDGRVGWAERHARSVEAIIPLLGTGQSDVELVHFPPIEVTPCR
jgi:hypothetical protein